MAQENRIKSLKKRKIYEATYCMWSCMTIIPAVPVQKQKLSPYNEIQFWGNRGLKNVQNMIRKPKILIDMYLKCIKTFLEFKWI